MTGISETLGQRDAVLREARQRLARLETEAHQIGRALACLAAADVPAAADEPGPASPIRKPIAAGPRLELTATPDSVQTEATESTTACPAAPPVTPAIRSRVTKPASHDPEPLPSCLSVVALPHTSARSERSSVRRRQVHRRRASPIRKKTRTAHRTAAMPQPEVESGRNARRETMRPIRMAAWRRMRSRRARLVPSWMVSLMFHVLLLAALGLVTMATLPDDRPILQASILDVHDPTFEQLSEVQLELINLDESLASDDLLATDSVPSDVLDVGALQAVDVPSVVPGEESRLEAPRLRDLSMAVAGTDRGGKTEGASKGLGTTSFFGTTSRGDRAVFLLDNSNSMDDGRFETALLELGRSVDLMAPKQLFYVIFYSDTVYQMFHPEPALYLVPATRQNKQKLHDWLRTAQMCTGGQLTAAIEVAERLNPHVVYLLSDGVIGDYPLKELIEPRERTFVLHTIGMTVPSADAAERLQAIAAANRGTFRSVGVNLVARRLALQHPIARNRTRGPVWGIKLPAP